MTAMMKRGWHPTYWRSLLGSDLKVFAIVPVKRFENGKTRLASLLSIVERIQLCKLLLEDTLTILSDASSLFQIVVVSSDPSVECITGQFSSVFLRETEERGVNAAIEQADGYCERHGAEATIVIPQDLPLLLPEDIDIMCDSAQNHEKCLAICPSQRYDGSNALLRKPSMLIRTSFDNNSYNMHIRAAKETGAKLNILLLGHVMTDLDTIKDVAQMLEQPTKSRSVGYLRSKLKP